MLDLDCLIVLSRRLNENTHLKMTFASFMDDSPEWMAWRHMMSFFLERDGKMPDAMLSVPTTTPLRSTSDIQRCIDAFEPGVTDEVLAQTPDSAPFVEEKNVPVESVTENRRNLRKSRTVVW